MKFNIKLATLVVVSIFVFFFKLNSKQSYYMDIAQSVYKILEKHMILYDIDSSSVCPGYDKKPKVLIGSEDCIKNIARFIKENKQLKLLLVGFPFKSPNHEKKTIGDLPDMAERKSLEYLQKILNKINAIYPVGVEILIFCDGIAFSEFFGIPHKSVLAYEDALKHLSADLSNIIFYTTSDIMKKHQLKSTADINILFDSYSPSDDEFRSSKIFTDGVAYKTLAARISVELDHHSGRKLLKIHKLNSIVFSALAREERMRNYIINNFSKDDYIRLTVHFSENISKKIGIKLSPNSEVTPYHGVLVEDGSSWSIKFKKDVDMDKYILAVKNINGINCAYFKLKF